MVIHHPWANNYAHGFADCLPRLLSVERYTSYPVLLPSDYQSFAWESLRALGVECILPMEAKYFYRVKRLILPHMPWLDSLALFYPQVQFYRERFLSLGGHSPAGKKSTSPEPKLLVARFSTKKRFVLSLITTASCS